MRKILNLINGPRTLENGKVFWLLVGIACIIVIVYPFFGSAFGASNYSLFFLYVPLALGLSLLWGFDGVLSFGQMAFFGIGGYTYGVVAINLAPNGGILTLVAGLVGLIIAAVVAAVFGYFMFYGGASGWIIPLLTLVLSLVLATFLGQTAGYQWSIGNAQLGGYNGMNGIPSIALGSGDSFSFFYSVVFISLFVYVGLRMLVNSRYGAVLVAIREDTLRTRLLGHNVDRRQVEAFTLAAVLAALSGVLYTAWGNYIDPSQMDLSRAALPVIWVAVGGRQSVTAVFLSTVLLGWLTDQLSVSGGQYALVVNGALLLAVMLFFPAGIFYTIARRLQQRRKPQAVQPAPAAPRGPMQVQK